MYSKIMNIPSTSRFFTRLDPDVGTQSQSSLVDPSSLRDKWLAASFWMVSGFWLQRE